MEVGRQWLYLQSHCHQEGDTRVQMKVIHTSRHKTYVMQDYRTCHLREL